MQNVKMINGSAFNLKNRVDVLIKLSRNVTSVKLNQSNQENIDFVILIPEEITKDRVENYINHYKRVLRQAKERKFYHIGLDALELTDEDETFEFAVELKSLLNNSEYSMMNFTVFCKDRDMMDLYELALLGEIKSAQLTMIDELTYSDALLVPTYKQITKFAKEMKCVMKKERLSVFASHLIEKVEPGQYRLLSGKTFCGQYFLINMVQGKVKKRIKRRKSYKSEQEKRERDIAVGIERIFKALRDIHFKEITIPLVQFKKDPEENFEFIYKLLEVITDQSEEHGVNVKLYVPDVEIWNYVCEFFEEKEDTVEDAVKESEDD